jgi:hypothetical protein
MKFFTAGIIFFRLLYCIDAGVADFSISVQMSNCADKPPGEQKMNLHFTFSIREIRDDDHKLTHPSLKHGGESCYPAPARFSG